MEPSKKEEEEDEEEEEEEKDLNLAAKVRQGIDTAVLFTEEQCREIEQKIEEVVKMGEDGGFKPFTVDRAPLRNK